MTTHPDLVFEDASFSGLFPDVSSILFLQISPVIKDFTASITAMNYKEMCNVVGEAASTALPTTGN